jgi:hypothetical protein
LRELNNRRVSNLKLHQLLAYYRLLRFLLGPHLGILLLIFLSVLVFDLLPELMLPSIDPVLRDKTGVGDKGGKGKGHRE